MFEIKKRHHRPAGIILALAMLVSVAACQPAPKSQTSARIPEMNSLDDPCSENLQNISGALWNYYRANHQFPTQLGDLRPYALGSAPLDFICPISHKSYLYYPTGLTCPDQQNQNMLFPQGMVRPDADQEIIACDPAPSHDCSRWCLFMSPIRPGSAMTTQVLLIPELAFRNYHPSVQ